MATAILMWSPLLFQPRLKDFLRVGWGQVWVTKGKYSPGCDWWDSVWGSNPSVRYGWFSDFLAVKNSLCQGITRVNRSPVKIMKLY